MMDIDKDALICDLAETYGIFDLGSIPVTTLATLCAGLHDDSRIKLKMAGLVRVAPLFTLVHISDSLTMLLSALAGEKKTPELYQDVLKGKQKELPKSGMTIEEFEAARARIVNG